MPHYGFNHSPARGGHRQQSPHSHTGQSSSAQNMEHSAPQGSRSSPRRQYSNQHAQSASIQPVGTLRAKIKALTKENESLNEYLENCDELHKSYRLAIEDKSLECADLRSKVETLEKQIASGTQGAGWGLSNLLSRSKDAQRSEHDELERLRKKLTAYKDAHSEVEDENCELQQKSEEQAQQIQAQIAEFTQELDDLRGKAFVKAPQLSDTEIQGQWNALGSSIKQFVLRYLRGQLDVPTMQQLAHHDMYNRLPEMARTMQVPFLRAIVLESWIWHFLCFRIFDSSSEFWAGKLGSAISGCCEEVRSILLSRDTAVSVPPNIDVEQFHDWRVRSAHFISGLKVHDRDALIEHTARTMLDSLTMVISSTISHGQLSDMQQDALGIVHKAAELDMMFRLSKADFHVFITRVKLPLVSPPVLGFHFDPETMEGIKEIPIPIPADITPNVDLAVSPGIFKAGNADGVNYAAERVLVKLRALCNLQAVLGVFEGVAETQGSGNGCEPEVKAEHVQIKQEDGGDDDVMLLPSPT